jgi:hypothetical protein
MTNNEVGVRKTFLINDQAKDTYLERVEFSTADGETKTIDVPPSMIMTDRLAFERKLRDAGANLPKKKEDVQSWIDAVAQSDAPEKCVFAKSTGWVPDQSGFVLPEGFVGASPDKILGVKLNDTQRKVTRSKAGSHQLWQETVARPATYSSAMLLTVAAAFAAPLLFSTRQQSFMINLVGAGAIGKTTATLMGASVFGTAQEKDLPTWNLTDAALEEVLTVFNDAMFPIDDLKHMKETGGARYARISRLAHDVTHGSPILRHSSFAGSQAPPQQGWCSIGVTSFEKSIRDLAHDVHHERLVGEARRLIDVPVISEGLDHIFDRAPDGLKPQRFHGWKSETFKSIRAGCNDHHGGVFEEYIQYLLSKRATVIAYVERRIAFFVKSVSDEFDGDAARDVARKFGLIYAGGMMGIRSKLLPWKKADLKDAIKKSYLAARALLPDTGVTLRQGISTLEVKLLHLPRASKKKVAFINFKEVDGYRKRRSSFNRCWIKCEVFNSLFVSRAQKSAVVDWLIAQGRITPSGPKTGPGLGGPQPKAQFKWPDGMRRRSFCIDWPRENKAQDTPKGKKPS